MARTALTRFEQAFATEYGAEPSPQTRRRIEQLLPPPFRFAYASSRSQKAPTPIAAPPVTETEALLPAAPRQPATPPVVLSRFFGRESEIRQLIALLLPKDWTQELAKADAQGNAEEWEPPCRLVTLTGPGGNGKTRLAIETARHLGERRSVRCSYVGLAEVTQADQIPGQIAAALEIVPSTDVPPLAQIAAFFAARDDLAAGPAVLVLDNLEHLLNSVVPDVSESDGAEAVRRLLERVPSLTLLCTSRRRLGLRGERAFPVNPLSVPPVPESELSEDALKTLVKSPSVRLYLDRAQAVRPDFTLTPVNAPAVAALCRQLEGSPLALELAVAWVRTLPPRKIVGAADSGSGHPAGQLSGPAGPSSQPDSDTRMELAAAHAGPAAAVGAALRIPGRVDRRRCRGSWRRTGCCRAAGRSRRSVFSHDDRERVRRSPL